MKRIAIVAAGLLASGMANAATEAEAMGIAQKNGCLACHQLDKKMVGPAWKEVGKKYAGQADAEAMLLTKVKKGGKGVWGPIPMPPNATVKDADIKTLVQFVLTLQ
ncbi:MAG: c-type cytochrome [Rhodocyclaceae bacterium]|jgi:cytochrome c|nr:c-type cytochrome [Rhodocyclaceae bacterium]